MTARPSRAASRPARPADRRPRPRRPGRGGRRRRRPTPRAPPRRRCSRRRATRRRRTAGRPPGRRAAWPATTRTRSVNSAAPASAPASTPVHQLLVIVCEGSRFRVDDRVWESVGDGLDVVGCLWTSCGVVASRLGRVELLEDRDWLAARRAEGWSVERIRAELATSGPRVRAALAAAGLPAQARRPDISGAVRRRVGARARRHARCHRGGAPARLLGAVGEGRRPPGRRPGSASCASPGAAR